MVEKYVASTGNNNHSGAFSIEQVKRTMMSMKVPQKTIVIGTTELKNELQLYALRNNPGWNGPSRIDSLHGLPCEFYPSNEYCQQAAIEHIKQGYSVLLVNVPAPNSAESLGYLRDRWFHYIPNHLGRRHPNDLRSHGFGFEKWLPPKSQSRFLAYDANDEAWMRPLGLGRIEEQAVNLYDVRDQHGSLVGYTDQSPSSYLDKGMRSAHFGERNGFVSATIRRFVMEKNEFLVWEIQTSDIQRHAHARFITVWAPEDSMEAYRELLRKETRLRDIAAKCMNDAADYFSRYAMPAMVMNQRICINTGNI